jgi:hypothetical protein
MTQTATNIVCPLSTFMKKGPAMKNSVSKFLCSLSLARAGLAPGLVILLVGGTGPRLAAQSDNFNSGALSSNWSHYDSGMIAAANGVSGLDVTYSFPTDGTGGDALRIQCPADAPYDSAFGPARALVFRTDVLYNGRFSLGVDVIAWNNNIDQAFGPFWFIQDPGPGTTDGYVLTFEPVGGNEVRISRVDSEVGTAVAITGTVVLDPTQRYRFLATSHDGSTFLGQVFNSTDLANPVAGAIASDSSYSGGHMGLLSYDAASPAVNGADVTYDNYNATAPAAGAMGATVAHLAPAPGERAAAIYPTVSVAILNRDTTVSASSILLWMDGTLVPASALTIVGSITEAKNPASVPNTFAGATVSYPIPSLLPPGSVHTNSIAFSDSLGSWQTNTWAWTTAYPYLFASNSLPIGTLSVPGFDARMVQSSAANISGTGGLDNSVASAEAVLANPPQYKVDLAATNIVQFLAWDLNATAYGAVTNFPGLCIPPATVNSFAVETFAYLQLTAGHQQFYVHDDDTVGIYSGTNLMDTSIVLVQTTGVTHAPFDFIVEADGLYPFHIIYEQGGGSAYLVLHSVNLSDNSQTLVNAPGGVSAFYPLVCKSSTSVAGPYTVDAAANAGNALTTASVLCDGSGAALNLAVTGGTLTVPISGPAKFYRLDGPRATQITSITKSGSNVVITYQAP